eukprot:scaffold2093_cov141-Alexandrium_tamarense.AAC.4
MQQELSLATTRALATRVVRTHMVCSHHQYTNLPPNHFRFSQTQTNFLHRLHRLDCWKRQLSRREGACYELYGTVADESCDGYKCPTLAPGVVITNCEFENLSVLTSITSTTYHLITPPSYISSNVSACRGGKGSIGSDSCNEYYACKSLEGVIHDLSCNGAAEACTSFDGTVHEHSCNDGYQACKLGNGNILEGSCNAEKSCYQIAGLPSSLISPSQSTAMISTGSCNAVEACYGVNGYDIGGCACNTANECKCSSVPGAYVCDDSSDVFTNAQDATCPVGAGQWFPDWAGANLGCVKNVGSNNAPSYMLYNPSMWMFDDLEDCCDKNYPWDLTTCLGASAAAGSDKWFVDYSLNKCVKECVGDEPCGGLVDGSWVDLFESQSECCSKKVWWNTECNA